MINASGSTNFIGIEAEAVLDVLTRRQFLQPHTSLRDVLASTIDEMHCCPLAIERAMQWLGLKWDQPIGRMRRTELMQLARVIHRLWNHAEAQKQAQSSQLGL